MTQPEARLVRKIKDALKPLGCYVVKHHGGEFGAGGVPDLLICVGGKFLALEVKRPETRAAVSPQQTLHMNKINEAGGIAAVVTSPSEAVKLVRRLKAAGVCARCGLISASICSSCRVADDE